MQIAKMLQELAGQIGSARQAFNETSALAFDRLEKIDPELTKVALDLLEDRDAATEFFASEPTRLEEPDHYAALANGKREQVLETIRAVQYGIYI